MAVAIIGTRNPDQAQIDCAIRITKRVVDLGLKVKTGGAHGIDTVAMEFAGKNCEVYLPWATYNQELIHKYKPGKVVVLDPRVHTPWLDSVTAHHPAPQNLTQGVRKLHARNYGIIEGDTRLVVALPSKDGGGTAQGMRIAVSRNIPMVVLSTGASAREVLLFMTQFEVELARIMA